MQTKHILLLTILSSALNISLPGQPVQSRFSGSFETTNQWYIKDTLIGALPPSNRIASNNYLKLDYAFSMFFTGLQYEAYLPPLVGFSPKLEGNKLVHRFFGIQKEMFTITAGNFYEQFGSGLLLRLYEDRQLGINNSLDGIHALFTPNPSITFKALYGKQRNNLSMGESIIRAADAQVDLFKFFQKESNYNISLGASWVNKFQDYTGPLLNFPTEVNALSSRLDINSESQSFHLEYAQKQSDPNITNNFSLRKGRVILLTHTITSNRLGINISLRRLENMDFRSDREASGTEFSLNYLPANTRQHKYSLANIYAYSTQPASEIGGQADLYYHLAKGSVLGGDYGANITANISTYYSIDTVRSSGTETFNSNFFRLGEDLLYRDINIEIEKRWNPVFKSTIGYIGIHYNKSKIEGGIYESVKSNILTGDFLVTMNETKALRFELQHLSTQQDKKNWAAALIEFSLAPKWAFFLSDQYNYGYIHKVHYYGGGINFSHQSTALAIRYGRQREGILCAGGICKMIPASSGLTISMNVSF